MTDFTTNDIPFFTIPNLSSGDVTKNTAPWAFDISDAPWGLGKAEWSSWSVKPSTDHCFMSLAEGAMGGIRVTKENEACLLYGFIADYDTAVPIDEAVATVKSARRPSPYKPAYCVQTFSGNVRLVWLFEKPLRVMGNDHAKRMMTKLAEELKAHKYFGGLDSRCINPLQYQCVGKAWAECFPGYRLPAELVQKWDFDVFKAMMAFERQRSSAPDIPFADIRDEARARGWTNAPTDFTEGKRCCRFWDPDSDNMNGCVIDKDGVRVYVNKDKPRMTWTDIFGKAFTDKYASSKFTAIAEDVWYEGARGEFWVRSRNSSSRGFYENCGIEALKRRLRGAGISGSVPKGGCISPVDEVVLYIETERRVDKVIDLLYFPEGLHRKRDNTTILNTSRIRVTQPSPPQADASAPWNSTAVSEGFPFLHGLITHLFDTPIPGAVPGEPTQIDRFLWWLAVFYKSGYHMKPRLGQVLFIAGAPSAGKSFLAKQVIPTLMGGVTVDTAGFLTGKRQWTSDFANQPVFNVDDDSSNVTPELHRAFELTLKKIAADGEIEWRKKFGSEATMQWFGRIITTMNLDPNAMRLVPDLSNSNGDKVTMLRAAERAGMYKGFGDNEYNKLALEREMPAFARYLLDLEIPPEFQHPRFGVVAFHHPEMLEASCRTDNVGSLLEGLDFLFNGLGPESGAKLAGRTAGHWEGTALELYERLSAAMPSFGREYRNARMLGAELSKMHRKGTWGIEILPEARMNRWKIPYDITRRSNAAVKREEVKA